MYVCVCVRVCVCVCMVHGVCVCGVCVWCMSIYMVCMFMVYVCGVLIYVWYMCIYVCIQTFNVNMGYAHICCVCEYMLNISHWCECPIDAQSVQDRSPISEPLVVCFS